MGAACIAERLASLPHDSYLMNARWRIYFRHRSGCLGYIDAPGLWLESPFGASWAMEKAHDWFRAQPDGMRGWWMESWQPLLPSSGCRNGRAVSLPKRVLRRLRARRARLLSHASDDERMICRWPSTSR